MATVGVPAATASRPGKRGLRRRTVTVKESRDQGRASWRGASQPRSRGWRTHRTASEPGTTGRFVLLGWLAGFLLLIGGILLWILSNPKELPFQAFVVTQYSVPLPPNRYAVEDAETFQRTFRPLSIAFDSAQDLDLRAELSAWLDAVKPGGPLSRWRFSKRGAVVVYISAHGAVREDGLPCLVSPQSPLDSRRWIPVRDLLTLIAGKEHLKHAYKLVIFDSGRIRDCWPIGVLHNGFADALTEVVDDVRRTEDANLFVLNSTRGDQQAEVAPELAGTYFGHSVAKGITGAADQDRDHYVDLAELAQYVQQDVARAVGSRRGRVQQPILIPATVPPGLRLTYASDDPAVDRETPSFDEPRDLSARWNQRDQRELESTEFVLLPDADPLTWALLDQQLLRAEQTLLAGKAYPVKAELDNALVILGKLRDEASTSPLTVCSIPYARQLGLLNDSRIRVAEQAYAAWRAKQSAEAAANGAVPAASDAEPAADASAATTATSDPVIPGYLPAAAAVWNQLLSIQPTSTVATASEVYRKPIQEGLAFVDSQPAR